MEVMEEWHDTTSYRVLCGALIQAEAMKVRMAADQRQRPEWTRISNIQNESYWSHASYISSIDLY